MPQSLIAYFPLTVLYAVVVAGALAFGANMGVETPWLAAGALAAVGAGLVFLAWTLLQRLRQREQHMAKIRLIAERWQAMLQGAPGGYCLFTIQGLLREAVRAPEILGIEKIAHIENIAAALKDSADFIVAFRNLQLSGKEFALQVERAGDAKPIRVTGQRLRVGREGPQLDMLWFSDGAATVASDAKDVPLYEFEPSASPGSLIAL